MTLNAGISPKCLLKCSFLGRYACTCIEGLISGTKAQLNNVHRFAFPLLTLRRQLPGPSPLDVMKVGCRFSAFLPTLASLVNWHHLLNGIA